MKRRYMLLILLIAIVVVVLALGPRPDTDGTIRFDPSAIGPDIDAYLAETEAAIDNLKTGTEKQVIWAGEPGEKTDLAIIYLHGFSATRRETEPLADDVAKALGANLYYTRLTGHGRDGAALAEASMNDWVNDLAEAIAIGERIGERIAIIGTSTGATLATWAAANPRLVVKVDRLVLISPNYAVRGASIGLLNMPWGEVLLPRIIGKTRSFEPHNDAHAKWWTTSYPSRAVFAMGALLKATDQIDPADLDVPAMFIYSPDDKVIEIRKARTMRDRWGGPTETLEITQSDDPSNHVIAGDILSPSTTDEIAAAIVAWLKE